MILPHDSPIVRALSRVLIPVVQIYAIYVLFHAQHSPGGGFVAGVLFGTSLVLSLLVFGTGHSNGFIEELASRADGLGLFLFAGIGVLCILGGEVFLNYESLEIPGMDSSARRSLGIVGTQIGVALDVAVAAISIFFSLSPQKEDLRG
jgi:multicomponent Na+:H+ antiporter subunit B